ncbi:MAG: hypothetical protein KF900_00955 [Bacteroidetes bacterium]|nr:hypothetical protein [Bacteroidota bacterium]
MKTKYAILTALCLLVSGMARAQETKVNTAVYDGILIVGYVDRGAFLNFTGPNINLVKGKSKFILGMLPSLRFKEDEGITRNAFVTPSLGVGFTYSYKIWAVQIPVYYNAKSAVKNGKWQIGVGVGLRLNGFKKKTI